MRAALWETSPGALAALLNSRAPVNKADLYTLILGNGTVYRWSGADIALSGGGNTWTLGPGLVRSKVRFTNTLEVDDLTVQILDNIGTLINGQRLMAFIRAGGLIGATLQVDKAFWPVGASQPTGALCWFPGRIADVKGGRYGAELTVRCPLELLDKMVPAELYQSGCLNTVFDGHCALARSGFTATGAATTGSDAGRSTFGHGLVQAVGYFDLGTITMTSGANNGISRSVKQQLATSIAVLNPWPLPVVAGDTFSIVPGCDGTQSTCTTKFSNLVHFRGQPYIPQAETAL